MANPSFIPEGYTKKEVKRDEPKPSFIPSGYKKIDSGTYKDPIKTSAVENQYIPELLRGTEFEDDVGFLENKLFSQGAEGFDTAVKLDRGKLAWSLQAFKGLTPDEAAEVQAIARVRNLPFDTVNNNKKLYKESNKARQVFNSLFEVGADGKPKYPVTSRMLSNPAKMAIAKDDVETLTKIEGLITAYNRGPVEILAHEAKEGFKTLSKGLLSTLAVEQHQKIFELDNELNSGIPKIVEGAQKEVATRELILQQIDFAKNSDFLRGIPIPRVSGAQGYLNDVSRVGAQVVASVLATKSFGPAGGLAVISGQIFGQTYDELKSKGIGHEKALKGATFNTVFQAAIEVLPATRLAALFKSTGIKEVIKQFFAHGFAEMSAEFLQEWPEGITDIWGEAQKEGHTLEEAKQIFKDRAPEIFMQGIYAGQVVAPYAFLPLAIKLPSDIRKVKQTKKDLDLFDAEMKIAEESKLNERSPEEYEEMSKAQHAAGGIAEDILIPKEIIESYHQDDFVGLKNTMEELDIVEQASEADVTGVFKVSRSKFAQKFAGTELAEAVRDHIRFTADGLSSVDAAKLNEQLPKALEEMQAEYNQLIKDSALPVQALRLREQLVLPKQAFVIRDANGNKLSSSVNIDKAEENLVKLNDQLAEGETLLEITEEQGFGLSAVDADTNMAIAIEGSKQLSKQSNETLDQWWARVNPVIKVSDEVMTFEGETIDPNTFEQTDPLGFYSKLRVGVQGMNFKKMPAKELAKRVKEIVGIKQAELDFTGIEELLESTEGKVSKEDIVKFLERGGLQLEEIVEGRGDDYTGQRNTRFDSYTLPGGTNYRIVRLILPRDRGAVDTGRLAFLEAELQDVEQQMIDLDASLQGVEREGNEHHFEGRKNLESDWDDLKNQIDATKRGSTSYDRMKALERQLIAMPRNERGHIIDDELYKSIYAEYDAARTEDRESGQDDYETEHWQEVNVLAHIRLNDRIDANGNKVLFIEEIQSDWHRDGAKKGYVKRRSELRKEQEALQNTIDNYFSDPEYKEAVAPYEAAANEAWSFRVQSKSDLATADTALEVANSDHYTFQNDESFVKLQEAKQVAKLANMKYIALNRDYSAKRQAKLDFTTEKLEALRAEYAAVAEKLRRGVPDAPFKGRSAWSLLAFKRVLHMASIEGYDSVAWTSGEQQVDRYDLSKQVSSIQYDEVMDGGYTLVIKDISGNEVAQPAEGYFKEELEELVGGEIAEKIINGGESGVIEGTDLRVGGEGLKSLYDKVLPNTVQRHVKKLDKKAKVGVTKIDASGSSRIARQDEVGPLELRAAAELAREAGDNGIVNSLMIEASEVEATGREVGFAFLNAGYSAGVYVDRALDYGEAIEEKSEINLANFEHVTTIGEVDYYSDPEISGFEYQLNRGTGNYSLNSSDGEGYGTFEGIEDFQAKIDEINELIREDNQYSGGVTIGQFELTDRLSDRSFYEHENGLSYVEMDTGVSHLWNRVSGAELGDFNSRSELKKALAKQASRAEVWSLPITEKLREEVLKGQTLFQEQGVQRGNVQFTDSGAVINLFGSANLSSFLHEMSHIFTNEQRQIINSGHGDQQFQDDFNALVDYAGGELNRAGHEKIARGFERYLKEGRAPSIQLTNAFRRIRDWMDAIYKVIKGSPIDVDINDEVRAIFDRILASKEDIAEANAYYSAKPSMEALIKLPLSVAIDLGDKDKKAEQTAIEKQTKASLAAYVQAEGGREAITKKVTKEIEGQQVYKAIKNAQDLGGIEPTEIEALRGTDAVKQMRQRHRGSIFKKLEDKGPKDYRGLVLGLGGVKASTLTAEDKKLFKESGASPRIYRKDGQGLDQLAQILEQQNYLYVPDDRTAADYLKELILDKTPIEDDVGFLDDIEGESLSSIALENNYASEEIMLDDMLAAQAKGKAIEAKTKEVIKARENEIKRQLLAGESIPGEDSFHSEERLTHLIAQAEALAAKIYREEAKAVDRLAAKIVKDAATDRISVLPVWKAIRYNDYSAAEKRYAKKAQDFLTEGKLVEAHEAIKTQAINHAMVLASIKARDAKHKIDARYKSKKINPKLKNAELEYRDNAAALIGTYDLNKTVAVPKTLTPLKSLDEILESLIPEWITNRVKPQNYRNHRDLPFGQFVQLDKAIGEILSSGTEELHGLENEAIKTVTDLEEASLETMKNLPNIEVKDEFGFLGAKTFLGPKLSLAEGFIDSTKKLEMIAERLDNYSFEKNKILGPLRTKVREGVDKEGDYNDKKQATLTAADKHLQGLYGAVKRLNQVHGSYAFDIPGVPTTEDMKAAGQNKWTAERVVSFVLNMGNDGNYAALSNSYKYNAAQVDAIVKQLVKKEIRAIQGIWDVTETLFPELDAAHFRIYNHHLERVEARELTLQAADGEITVRGGYYPLMFDHNLNFQAKGQKLTEDAKRDDIMANRDMNVVRSAKPKNGATFHRTKGHRLPPMLAFSEVWFTHVNDVIRYTTHSEYLRDMNRLIKRPAWRARVIEVSGEAIYKGISSSVSYQALPERRRPDGKADAIMDGLRKSATTAILGLNAAVGIKQRVSQINAVNEIGWKYLAIGYASTDIRNSTLGIGNGKKYQNMLKLSKLMRLRDGNISREISDFTNSMNPLVIKIRTPFKIPFVPREFTWRDVQDFSFEWIQMNDRATVGVVWYGAFAKGMDENANLNEKDQLKKAIQYANIVVQNTQPSSIPIDLSEAQRAEGALRLFTAFSTFTMGVYGNRVQFKYRAWRDGAITNRQYFNHILNDTVLPSFALVAISTLISRGELPDKEQLFWAPLETLISWMPWVRDIASLKYGRAIGESPTFEFPNRIAKAVDSTKYSITKNKNWDRALWDIGRAVEIPLGFPALNVVKQSKNTYDIITGQKKKRR